MKRWFHLQANAEADSFSCFVRLLSDSVDHFCEQLDNSAVGILATLSRLSDLLKANDEELWRHLECTTQVIYFRCMYQALSMQHFSCKVLQVFPFSTAWDESDLQLIIYAFFEQVKPQYYAFRWITLLLTQEFNFQCIMRIWDSLLANPFGVQVCSLLTCSRAHIHTRTQIRV